MSSPYLSWLIIFIVLPTVFIWLFYYSELWKYRMVFLRVIFMSLLFGIAWDLYATATHFWLWPPECCFLLRVCTIPLEEVVFIVLVACYIPSVTLTVRTYI